MEINRKNRTELKSYFLANKIPTQKNFEDFIDAVLNQSEDGIAKTQGNPLAIQAEGDENGTQETLHLYKNFNDKNPAWSVSLNPRTNAGDPATGKPGLNISDAGGNSCLFIKSAGGNAGLGTIEPEAKLHIKNARTELRIENTKADDWAFVSIKGPGSNYWDVAQKGDSDSLEFRPKGGEANKIIMKNDGSLTAPGGVMVSGNRSAHMEQDGSIYRFGGQMYITVDDNLYIRDAGNDIKMHFDTNKGRIGVNKQNPEHGVDINGDLRANNLFGEGSGKIEWIVGFNDKAATAGTWNPAGGWGEPKFSASCAYCNTSGTDVEGTESLDFNIPDGAKTAYISALAWTNTGYFDIMLNFGGAWKFHRRVNQYNAVRNATDGGTHDGNYITMAATGLDHASQIRIQNRKGRIHFTGMGFTREDMSGAYDPGFTHQDNIVSPHIVRGMIIMWTGSSAPNGWALCDGSNGTPDLRGRFILGYGNGAGLTNRLVGQAGGNETHTLNLNEIPPHSHPINTRQDDWNVSGGVGPSFGKDNGAYQAYHRTENAGGGQAHNNMPPYYVLAFIMKL